MAVRASRESQPAKSKAVRTEDMIANRSAGKKSFPLSRRAMDSGASFEQRLYQKLGLAHVLAWISNKFGEPTESEIGMLDRSSLQGIRLKTHYVEVGCLYKTSFYLPPLAVAMTSGDAIAAFLISIPTGGYMLLAMVERYQRFTVKRALSRIADLSEEEEARLSQRKTEIEEQLQDRGACPETSFMGFYFRLRKFESPQFYERFGFERLKNWVETKSEEILSRYSEPQQSLSLHRFERPSRSEVLKFSKRASQNEAAHLIGFAMNVPIFLRFVFERTFVGFLLMTGYLAVDAGLSFLQRYNRVRITTSRLYLRAQREQREELVSR